jgi:hypothetical protein
MHTNLERKLLQAGNSKVFNLAENPPTQAVSSLECILYLRLNFNSVPKQCATRFT